MLEQKKERLKIRVDELDQMLQKLHRHRKLIVSEEWREIMGPWLEGQIGPLRDKLERPDLRPGETTAIRGMIAAWRVLERLQGDITKDMERIAVEAAGLQDKLEEWHTRGHSDLGTAVSTVARIAKPRQRRQRR